MEANGRENYRRAVEFRAPARLPVELACKISWLEDQDEAKLGRIRELQSQFPEDMLTMSSSGPHLSPPIETDGVRRWVDEWGTGWEDDGHGGKTESYPIEDGYHLLESYTFPDPDLPGRFDRAADDLSTWSKCYANGLVWFTLFERLWMLRGFNNMLMDPYLDPSSFSGLRDRILEINLRLIDHWVDLKVDGVYFSDDWGTQRGLLISPDDWRRFYKPAYAAMFDRVRRGGAHVWMHLCGDVSAILGDLVDIGINVLNPVQPQAMDIHKLSRDFGGKLCFWGGVDVQGTLIRGTTEDVRNEIHELVRLFGRFNGGYIGGTSHSVMPETPLDNVIAMYETFGEHL